MNVLHSRPFAFIRGSIKAMAMHKTTGALYPTSPFDLSKSLAFIGGFTPAQGEQQAGDGTLRKVFAIDGAAVLACMEADGDVEQPRLVYELRSALPLEQRAAAMEARLRMYLSLDDELRLFYTIAGDDPPFAHIVERLYGYHQVTFASPWEAACWAIRGQRTPMPVAQRAKQRIVERWGPALEVEGRCERACPEPAVLAGTEYAELAELTGGERKAGYLQATARAFADVDQAWLSTAAYDEVETWLRAIGGIGAWSAGLVLLRGLGRMEQLPGERRLLQAASRVYGYQVDQRKLERLAERYGSYRGYWAHYLRVAG